MAPKKIEKELPPQIEKLVKNGTPPIIPRKSDAELAREAITTLTVNGTLQIELQNELLNE